MRLISFLFHMDGILEPMGRWGPGKEWQCSINPTGRSGKQQVIAEEDEGEMKGGGRLYFSNSHLLCQVIKNLKKVTAYFAVLVYLDSPWPCLSLAAPPVRYYSALCISP